MALLTTTIGAFPKPEYLEFTNWFDLGLDTPNFKKTYASALNHLGKDPEKLFIKGTREVVLDQVNAGIDIPTDGEVRRENYIHYHCRHLEGIDFEKLSERTIRGIHAARLPTITGPIRSNGYFLSRDFTIAQSFTNRPIKMTLPGPMTIGDTLADDYYGDAKQRGSDIAEALNKEVLELAKVGCRYIQIDDPLFARYPQDALTYGFDHIEKCFHNCPQSVLRTVHICCGYPDRLDNPNFPKAPPQSYLTLSNAIENSSIQAVSIEDAHMNNDLSLLDHFKTTTVILGVVAIATTRVETVEEIEARLKVALDYIDRERLMVAPDCGLRMLGRDLALNKLVNLATAAKRIE